MANASKAFKAMADKARENAKTETIISAAVAAGILDKVDQKWIYDNNKKRNKKERRNRFTKEDVRRLNDVFMIGSLKSGEETYKVVSADAKKKEVVLLYNGRKVTISSESLVAREIRKAPKLTRPPKRKSNNNNI